MINFAVIGTSKITREFLKEAMSFPNFHLEAVYSRDYEKGLSFGKEFLCEKIYTDLDSLGKDSNIHAVYIASPNFLHCSQALKLMKYKKHILGEKPFASNSLEVEEMIKVAKENHVLLMEAMKTPFMPIIQNIKENLHKIGKIRRVFFNYCQYSSRYDNFRNGIVENAFKPELSNGAIMDIGIYPLLASLYLFGEYDELSAKAEFLNTGVDGIGTITMKYSDFLADIHYSKITNSLIPSEIQGEDGNIVIDKVSIGQGAKIFMRNGEVIDLGEESKDAFHYEIKEFLSLIENNEKQSQIMSHNTSKLLMKTLDRIRKEIGLVYPADENTKIEASDASPLLWNRS